MESLAESPIESPVEWVSKPVAESLTERFDKVFIDTEALASPVAKRIQKLFPADKIEVVTDKPLKDVSGQLSAKEYNQSKRLIHVTPFKGHFFKKCPGAKPGHVCCNYFVLNLGQQCDMNCSYCYLQSFINSPLLTIYSNLDQAMNELREVYQEMGQQPVRIGTGEVIDSLSLDPITGYASELITFFRDYPTWKIEFKTKSKNVDQFLDTAHANNVIVSWSVNPQHIIDHEEHGTASLDERLAAARKVKDRGFTLAFHLDPVIYHADWEANYTLLVDAITSRFTPQEVPYLSLGALRFNRDQRHMMRERFGMQSYVTQAEVFPSEGGRMRYDLALRRKMFDFILKEFKTRDPKWSLYMCMETPEAWLSSSFAAPPRRQEDIRDLFLPIQM